MLGSLIIARPLRDSAGYATHRDVVLMTIGVDKLTLKSTIAFSMLAMIGLGACSSTSSSSDGGSPTNGSKLPLGANVSFVEADAAGGALGSRLDAITKDEGFTSYQDLPAGRATYVGLVGLDLDNGAGEGLRSVGNLRLDADFEKDAVTGSMRDFVTDDGTDVVGSLSVNAKISEDPSGDATLAGAAFGALVFDRTSGQANLSLTGDFSGATGQGIVGDITGTVRRGGASFDATGEFGAERL